MRGDVTPFCITLTNANAAVSLKQIIHAAEPGRRIPKTQIDGNVYANGAESVIGIREQVSGFGSAAAFSAAMTKPPVGIGGLEARGLSGDSYVNPDGSPTAALNALHQQAARVPSDPVINEYIRAGTRHYGVLSR